MVNPIFAAAGTSIFETISRLAIETGAINLGQGFPEGMEPPELVEAAIAALRDGPHQYPPMLGLPALRQAVAQNAARFLGVDCDWTQEVLVTSGATEALADSFLALIEPGDEVIILEPAYDAYSPLIRRAGGVPVPVQMLPPQWQVPTEALAAAVTGRTRMIVINNPMNPIGRVFDDAELAFLADLAISHDLTVVADEVYEHLVFDDRPFLSLLAVPGLRERVVHIGSAGKTFSVTGWKVGYIIAAPALMAPIARAHQFVTFTTPPALQAAVAMGLALPDAYFNGLRRDLQARRDLLVQGLQGAGFAVDPADATYFVITDVSDLQAHDGCGPADFDFCLRLTREAGVAAVPISSFYGNRDVTSHIRFCFAKRTETLQDAIGRLADWRKGALRA
ncbi:aminotransferase [Szabonella alba]|uniref:Aminotransferase n=1 Tax=Szabonella alba TaxID=2804194 RepID=A0A8K0Y1F4_9RHOB|nr:aminotransferase [Szabonella alba]MBL4915964.1 aminotransferase [Szabonella alba]